ncbi:50S ribosomal protein L21 [Candidatus Moduliflexus flocculans]|uniref:Large ribosomal subunit protein bL21 n=1 Tax=Candidatus Moduliflexus flocculans TaxID=1499966 RepID=A0A0S6W0C7_9BACT|nr:50S ribosomal protein L21 [Candidatus Moduliflexus flocculans]
MLADFCFIGKKDTIVSVEKIESYMFWRSCIVYAVIKTGGKQHAVTEGEVLRVEKLDAEPGSEVVFKDVLMVKGADDKVAVGAPILKNASVTAEVVEHGRGKKIIVFKYKRKKNYQRKQGHRQDFTAVRIKAIAA